MSWSTNSEKIAATFGGLGFKITSSMTEIIELKHLINLRYFISDTSLLRPQLPTRDDLYRGWMEGTLAKLDPEHPFLCGMHGCHSYDALLDYQAKGTRYALKLVKDSPLYRYEPGQEDSRLTLATALHAITDLPLAAALALEGLPVIDVQGEAPRRRYLLPDQTLRDLNPPPQIVMAQKEWRPVVMPLEDGRMDVAMCLMGEGEKIKVADMLKRKEPGRLPLQLGTTHPHHRVVQGYNVTRTYARLLSDRKAMKKRLLIKDPFSGRRALIGENPTQALEDEVAQHFRVQ